MEELKNFLDQVEKIMKRQTKYKFEAYSFVMAALHDTVSKLKSPRHVSGAELVDGIRVYALDQYGALTRTVLNYWGIHVTKDFGEIVFALVDAGVLRKQDEDKLEDFVDVYDFEEAFDKGYEITDE